MCKQACTQSKQNQTNNWKKKIIILYQLIKIFALLDLKKNKHFSRECIFAYLVNQEQGLPHRPPPLLPQAQLVFPLVEG